MSNCYGKWKPFGDQFAWACRVCANEGSLKCIDCKREVESGFKFDCNKYVKLYQEFSEERYFWCGDKHILIGGARDSGKVFHLEQALAFKEERLKRTEEERDYWKGEAISAIHQLTRTMQAVVENCVARPLEK